MMINECCAFISSEKIKDGKEKYFIDKLRSEIENAIFDGYKYFICSMVNYMDLVFARLILDFKDSYHIKLEAAIPNCECLNNEHDLFNKIIFKCDLIGVYSHENTDACIFNKNKIMVENSKRLISVYSGRASGMVNYTKRYARSLKREIVDIRI